MISIHPDRKDLRISSRNYRGGSQTQEQQKQASPAVSLYHELVKSDAKIANADSLPQANRVSSGKGLIIKSSSPTLFNRENYKEQPQKDQSGLRAF